ncbi:MAG: hypothetical protein R3A79_26740 [Nannocystaceae bacterium]
MADLADETIKLEFGPMLVAAGYFKQLRALDPIYRAAVAEYMERRAHLAMRSHPLSTSNPNDVHYACAFHRANKKRSELWGEKFLLHEALVRLAGPPTA